MQRSSSTLVQGIPELLLLQLLSRREMYGYELAKAVRLSTSDAISLGENVLYPALHSMEARRLIKAHRRTIAGRTRIYYFITSSGRKRLLKLTENWQRVASAIDGALAGGDAHG
jgi:PadR family transcriptional regulator, regulatory protein PadR